MYLEQSDKKIVRYCIPVAYDKIDQNCWYLDRKLKNYCTNHFFWKIMAIENCFIKIIEGEKLFFKGSEIILNQIEGSYCYN